MTVLLRPGRIPVEKAYEPSVPERRYAARIARALDGLGALVGSDPQQLLAVDWEAELDRALGQAVADQLQEIATAELAGVAKQVSKQDDQEGVSFQRVDPWLVAMARWVTSHLVREVSTATKEGVRQALTLASRQQVTGRQAVDMVRSLVGLTARQADAVERYHQELLAKGTRPDRAASMRDAYAARTRARRASLIARTEWIRASGAGRQAAWRQAGLDGLIDADRTQKEWSASYGACPICSELDGHAVTLEGQFPGGVLHPPAHPACRCTMILRFEPVEKFNPYHDAGGRFASRGSAGHVSWGKRTPPEGHPAAGLAGKLTARDKKRLGSRGGGGGGGSGESHERPASKPNPAAHEPAGHVGPARSFKSNAEGKAFIGEHFGGWHKGMSKEEGRGLSFYQSPGFELMNGQLRGHHVSASPADLKRASQASKALHSAIRRAPPLREAVTVHRGFSAAQFDLKPGARVTDKGFVSMSLTAADVSAVSRHGPPAVATIRLPAGTRAGAGYTRELILPPGSSFRVVNVAKRGKTTHVEMDLLP